MIKLPAKSVGSRELKSNAVTSAKIRNGSIARGDLRPTARGGARGPRGPQGPAGADGAPGDAVAPEAWRTFPYAAAWGNYGQGHITAAYRKDARGRVYLRGLVTKTAGTPAQSEPIGILPPGYQPTGRMLFAVGSGGAEGQIYGRIDVLITGEVLWISGGTGEQEYASLDSISFWAN